MLARPKSGCSSTGSARYEEAASCRGTIVAPIHVDHLHRLEGFRKLGPQKCLDQTCPIEPSLMVRLVDPRIDPMDEYERHFLPFHQRPKRLTKRNSCRVLCAPRLLPRLIPR